MIIKEIVSLPFKAVASKWKNDIDFARSLLVEAGVTYREIKP